MARKQSIKDLVKAISSIKDRGLFSFAAETVKEGLKNRRQTEAEKSKKAPKEPTPSRFAFVTVQHFATVSLGNNYEQAVNNRLLKEGKEANFEAQGTYCHFVSDNRLVMKHNDRDQFYLRVYPDLCHSFVNETRVFDAEGTELSKEEWEAVRDKYFDKKDDGIVAVRNYKLENVLWLKRDVIHIEGGKIATKRKA